MTNMMKGVKELMKAAVEFVGAEGGLHVVALGGGELEAEGYLQADLPATENDHRLEEEVWAQIHNRFYYVNYSPDVADDVTYISGPISSFLSLFTCRTIRLL